MKNIIFDKKGNPSLKIIKKTYLVSNSPNLFAGYIEGDTIHDFNGNHRGWLSDGILRDLNGHCVGFMHNADGESHPKFPQTKAGDISNPDLQPPLKPAPLNIFSHRPTFKKKWASDKNPITLMIP